VFPGAAGLFADIDSLISLAFLTRCPTQGQADWLTAARLARWLSSAGYSGKAGPAVLHARPAAAPRGATGADGRANAAITATFVAVLTSLAGQVKALTAEIGAQLAAHADAHIFTSLPRAGRVRAARLLAEIGDCRGRFPTPGSLAGLAGVAPFTRQSGKIRTVGFRWACDKQLRDAAYDPTRHGALQRLLQDQQAAG
jgi:transposase